MSDKPNVTVIYQDVPSKAPGLLTVLVELLAFVLFLALAGLVAVFIGM